MTCQSRGAEDNMTIQMSGKWYIHSRPRHSSWDGSTSSSFSLSIKCAQLRFLFLVNLYSIICHTTSNSIFLVFVRLGITTDFLVFVPLMSASPYGWLGITTDFLVFFPSYLTALRWIRYSGELSRICSPHVRTTLRMIRYNGRFSCICSPHTSPPYGCLGTAANSLMFVPLISVWYMENNCR